MNIASPPLSYPPVRSISDIERLEQTPLNERIASWDFAQTLITGCRQESHKPAIQYIENGDSRATPQIWTYGQLEQYATQVANLLRASGLKANDTVAIVSPTLPSLYAAFLGTFLSCRPFPTNWMLEPQALAQLFAAADIKGVIYLASTPGYGVYENVEAALAMLPSSICRFTLRGPGSAPLSSDLLESAARHSASHLTYARRPPGRATIAAYMHSGGTTGAPKIVKITNGGLVYRLWTANLGLALTPDDVMLSDTPLFHIGGLCGRGLAAVAAGMCIVIPTPMGARNKTYLEHYWRFIERFGITFLSGVPTTLSVLAKHPPTTEDIRTLRPYFATGSTALAPAVQQRITDISGARPLVMYGLTENTSNVTIDPRDGFARAGCSGLRTPYTEVRVVELCESGHIVRDCETGERGMLLVRGPGVAAGYLGTEDRSTFREDGYLLTGDIGSVDDDGYVRIWGRQKDVIIRGGHNIDPQQIEWALMQAPEVALAAAVAKPDAHAGELPIAYVQLQEGASISEEALLAFARSRISERAATPKEVVIVSHLPLSAVGKPMKYLLMADAAQRALQDALREAPCQCEVTIDRDTSTLSAQIRTYAATPADLAAIHRLLSSYTVPYTVLNAPSADTRLSEAEPFTHD